LLFRTPETAKNEIGGQICTSPVEWFDVGPTLVELAGGEINYQQFAKSLCNVLEKPIEGHRDYAISELNGEIMLLSREWKIALNTLGEVYLLFSVQEDPDETANLAGLAKYKNVENQLRHCILNRLAQSLFQKK
jgi:choline-sulfatase